MERRRDRNSSHEPSFCGLWSNERGFARPLTPNTERESPALPYAESSVRTSPINRAARREVKHTTQILCFEMTLTAAVQPDTSSSYFGSNGVSRDAEVERNEGVVDKKNATDRQPFQTTAEGHTYLPRSPDPWPKSRPSALVRYRLSRTSPASRQSCGRFPQQTMPPCLHHDHHIHRKRPVVWRDRSVCRYSLCILPGGLARQRGRPPC